MYQSVSISDFYLAKDGTSFILPWGKEVLQQFGCPVIFWVKDSIKMPHDSEEKHLNHLL